eukprot:1721381-Amphidinium_carterae.1
MVRLGATMHSARSWTLANGAQVDLQVHSPAWIRLQRAHCSELWADCHAQALRRGQVLHRWWEPVDEAIRKQTILGRACLANQAAWGAWTAVHHRDL